MSKVFRYLAPGSSLALGCLGYWRGCTPPQHSWCSECSSRGPAGPSWENSKVAAELERNYLNAEVVAQRKRILEILKPELGERIIDVGCGPGLLVVAIADAVGQNGRVYGLDPSKEMLALGQHRISSFPQVQLQVGSAERLPFQDASIDAVVFAQVLCYVEDVPRALREVHRVLKPGGRILVLDTDWQGFVINSADEARSKRVLQSNEHHFLDSTLPRKLPRLLKDCGFHLQDVVGVPMIGAGVIDEARSWVGHVVFRSLPKNARTHPPSAHELGDADGFVEEQRRLNENGDFFAAVNRYMFLATR